MNSHFVAKLLPCCLLLLAGLSAETAFAAPVSAAETARLASLDLSAVEQGFGKPQIDKSVDMHPLSIAGRHFEHGLGTHSPGDMLIDLNGGATRFTAWVGIDDETNKRGSAEFQIVGDGKLLWSSGVMRGGQEPKRADIDVTGVQQIALIVGDAGDGYEYDHADWADAEFTFTGAAPKAIKLAPSNPTVAPTAEPDKPQITVPGIIGIRLNTPVLFTVSAVGQPPIRYAAKGLPRGLNLDAETGQIRGTVTQVGTHTLTVTAKNAMGTDSRKIQLVAGDTVCLTPPLGWNSYDCFGDNVVESEILANARYAHDNLLPHGWEYIIVDYRWYDPNAATPPNNPNAHKDAILTMDQYGRLEPAPNRFPSAANGKGFKPLADTIHGMGLKFGIHIMRGIPRQAVKQNVPIEGSAFHAADAAKTASVCPWCPDMYGVDTSQPAGQAWYDSILRQYASWGVDYIKVDDMSAPYSAGEIEAVRKAIDKCGRAIAFSLSPGDTPVEQAKHVQANANLWRISGDFWDEWGAVSHQFDLISRWQGNGGPGRWPDADMIPLGHLSVGNRSVGNDRTTRLTRDEQLTMMSLWAIAPSPLMLGMNLPDNDAWTLSLLTNDEVLAINQDKAGKQAVRLPQPTGIAGTEIWTRAMADGSHVIGLFNRLRVSMPVHIRWSEIGLAKVKTVRDVWQRKDLPVSADEMETTVGPHGAMLFRITTH